ncbi:MAG: hypothetical protein ABIB93_04920, partial [Chloroflexota bacterium]
IMPIKTKRAINAGCTLKKSHTLTAGLHCVSQFLAVSIKESVANSLKSHHPILMRLSNCFLAQNIGGIPPFYHFGDFVETLTLSQGDNREIISGDTGIDRDDRIIDNRV